MITETPCRGVVGTIVQINDIRLQLRGYQIDFVNHSYMMVCTHYLDL